MGAVLADLGSRGKAGERDVIDAGLGGVGGGNVFAVLPVLHNSRALQVALVYQTGYGVMDALLGFRQVGDGVAHINLLVRNLYREGSFGNVDVKENLSVLIFLASGLNNSDANRTHTLGGK